MPTPTSLTFAELYEGAAVICRRLGLSKLHILGDDGRPIATFEVKKPGWLARIDQPRYSPGEAAVNVSLVLSRRRAGR